MEETRMTLRGKAFRLILLDTAVVGTGCAGYNAADSLYDLGRTDTAIFTEGIGCGTSRNTGSDKQTYYKLSLASDGMDSIRELAQTLFDGGGVHGDTALAEAAGSVRCFMKLVNLGVPFPTNRFGEYVGYKTDHDPRQRATSAGPLTSRFMTEALERSVRDKGIPIFDGMQAVRLVIFQDKLCGMICLDTRRMEFVSVCCNHLILATGGPAGVYADSVYPHGQIGASGLAVAAGAVCSNLHAWQYGLASLKFRWNVSGTYQQVLPRYISVDQKGGEREFLRDFFVTPDQALDNVFLKGYQWPFDAQRYGGSSRIDLIVRHEIKDLGRRVFLDYRRNPTGLARGMQGLGKEAFRYLERSGVLGGTPVERLEKMNPEAVALYRRHGIDLYRAGNRRVRPAPQLRDCGGQPLGEQHPRPVCSRRGGRNLRRLPAGRRGAQCRAGRSFTGGGAHRRRRPARSAGCFGICKSVSAGARRAFGAGRGLHVPEGRAGSACISGRLAVRDEPACGAAARAGRNRAAAYGAGKRLFQLLSVDAHSLCAGAAGTAARRRYAFDAVRGTCRHAGELCGRKPRLRIGARSERDARTRSAGASFPAEKDGTK